MSRFRTCDPVLADRMGAEKQDAVFVPDVAMHILALDTRVRRDAEERIRREAAIVAVALDVDGASYAVVFAENFLRLVEGLTHLRIPYVAGVAD
jgi:hypothetical protein